MFNKKGGFINIHPNNVRDLAAKDGADGTPYRY